MMNKDKYGLKLLLIIPLVLFSTSCGPFVDVVKIDPQMKDTVRTDVKIYEQNELKTLEYETIQPINATSCKNLLWDPPPSQEDAIDQLRYKAHLLGSNGLTNLICTSFEGTSLSKNCWSSITCQALSIKVVSLKASPSTQKTSFYLNEIPDFKASAKPNDISIVIGIENYQGLPKSDYSKNDADIVKDYLKALGLQERNIELLTDEKATFSGITKSIEAWLPNRVKKDSRVVIYYSGHGASEPKTGDAYIIPFDGDPNYLPVTGYSLKRLYDNLGKLQVAEVVVILDSCFSGAGGRSVLAKGARPLIMMTDVPTVPSNIVVLTAAQGTQISVSSPEKGHGIFTYYFLKALKDGKNTVSEIYEYIKPLVEDEAKALNVQQSPSISPDVEKLKGRFILRK